MTAIELIRRLHSLVDMYGPNKEVSLMIESKDKEGEITQFQYPANDIAHSCRDGIIIMHEQKLEQHDDK